MVEQETVKIAALGRNAEMRIGLIVGKP